MHHLDGDFIYESVTRSTEAEVARPPCAVSSTWRRERGGVQRRVWRGPRALCFRGADCEAAGVRSGFGGSTLPDGVWRLQRCYSDRSRMAVPARYGVVCFSLLPFGVGMCPHGNYICR